MRNYILCFILLLFPFCDLVAKDKKKEQPTPIKTLLKNARAAIKDKKDQAKNLSTLEDALKRSDVSNEQKSEIRYTEAQLSISLNEAENLKAYLKQQYDTTAYFKTLLQASQYALLCDSTDTLPNEKGKLSVKYRNKNRELLLKCRRNLYEGGRFHLRKNDYKTALPYLVTYADMVYQPILAKDDLPSKDTLLIRAKYYAAVAAYNSKQPDVALRYFDDVIPNVDTHLQPNLQEYKARSLAAVGDTVNAVNALKYGCETYPKHSFFFTTLSDHYEKTKQYDLGIQLADSMLKSVQDISLYWYVKSVMYLHKEDWKNCAAMCDSTLIRDPNNTNALYNQGISYVNMAMQLAETACYDLKNPKCKRDRQNITNLYLKALPSFVKLRKLLPDDKQRWAPILYRIYLNTNKGKEFEEIENLMKEANIK